MEIEILNPSEVSIDHSSKMLEQHLEEFTSLLENCSNPEDLKHLILLNFSDLCDFYIEAANIEFQKDPSLKIDSKDGYLYLYALAKPFKDIMLLNRDVLLQLQISSHKQKENLVSEEAIQSHFLDSQTILQKALREFRISIEQEYRTISRIEKAGKQISKRIKHQHNPWGVYKLQFLNILEQIQLIDTAGLTFLRLIEIFFAIKAHTKQSYTYNLEETKISEQNIEQILISLKGARNYEDITAIISEIDGAIKKIETSSRKLEEFSEMIDLKSKFLSSLNFPTDTNQGMLLIKKIDFNKSVKKWLDYELLPFLIDVWENQNNLASYYKHSLLNLKSSLLLIKSNKTETVVSSQIITLKEIGKTISLNIQKQEHLIQQIHHKLSTQFLASNIYGVGEFLEVSFQSSFTQYTSGGSGFILKWYQKMRETLQSLNSSYEKSISSAPKNLMDQSINCIHYRLLKEENPHYDTLFLNKNFIGDLFLVSRIEEENTLIKSFKDWQQGSNKSALITGNGLSGKSTFIEDFAKQYFGKETILLQIDTTITIEGRKFKTSRNLKEALQEVNKNIYNTKPVLIIDDLEFWRSEEVSLLDNIRALINFVLSGSDRVFVIVSLSNAMQKHVDKRLPFSNAFTTQLDLNKAKFEEVFKAVLIRHGASHKKLVDKDKNEISNKQIENKVQELAGRFNYNIGEVLQAWAYSTKMTNDNLVIFEEAECAFQDFFTQEEVIILKYVYLYKYVNEMLLKSFLGKSFNVNFDFGIKRLISTKVLWRNSSGNLILNRVITTDVFEILTYRGTLN
tara:strand:- start:49828 stop:52209 length:2382 start_codon:yes stop_codon:yes gene_type:complete